MGRVGFGSGHIILLIFLFDSNLIRLNLDQKILIYTVTGHGSTRPDPCKIIKYLLIIFIQF
jgi:hypothetical protein